MLFKWILFILSFVPLLMCQQPDCANLTPTTLNDTHIDQLSGKWYYVASAFGFLPYKEEAQTVQSSFYYLIPNKTNDIVQGKEYNTIGDKCVYQESEVLLNRTNGTLIKTEQNQKHVAHIALTQDPNAFLFFHFPNDKVLRGVVLSVRTQKATEEQLKEFREVTKCLGFKEEEIQYTDWTKDKCEPLEKEHNQKESKETKETKEESSTQALS
ncbi:alpha-1-acid glycoprotein 1 [Macrotis lagotis]|uniref:alpha-1-acid glycoprotein 1 n=1 Tax=Macrotis lagotis TaxID=92651 RepID=UPI003D697B46